ncbi:MAG: terminase large subunit domain-containing protein [Bacillota bacterium]
MNVLWQPQPGPQIAFHKSNVFEVLYGGAAGGGKSDSLLMEGLRQADKRNYRAIIFRRTFPELQELIDRSMELFPRAFPGAKWNEQKKRWTFPSGAIYYFGAMEHEKDKHKYQGRQFQYIAFDELTQFEESQYIYLFSRCRTKDGSIRCYIRSSSNPGGVGHSWVKARFVDNGPFNVVTDAITGLTRCFIPSKVYDNKVLMQNDPDYIKRLLSLPEDDRRALLEGDWDVWVGQYFREFRREIHTIAPFAIPPYWKRFRSLDYGLDCTACYWWAVDQEGVCYIYRELWQSGLTLSQAAKRILELTPENEQIQYTVGSPDLFNRRQDTGKAGVETMHQAGLTDIIRADDRRVPGWRQLREYLQPFEREGRQTAMIQIFNTCTQLIKHLPMLIHDEHTPEDAADKPHEITHSPESIRYGIMSRPPLTERNRKAPSGTAQAIMDKILQEEEMSKYIGNQGVDIFATL